MDGRILLGIYLLSGSCSLVYEVIWRRLLKVILGNTTYATSITIAVFLGGLALGAILVRNRADGIRAKLRVYAGIELLISLTAVAIPFALSRCDHMYASVFRDMSPSPPVILLLQIAVSSVILLVPAILMGTTLPILSAWLVRRIEQTGRLTGRLYAMNTFGALAGTFVSGFYLIRLFGISTTYYIAIALNIVLAGLAFFLSRRDETGLEERQPAESREKGPPAHGRTYPQQVVLTWLFVSGFVALGYEILWVRSIIHFLGAEIYVFSAVLCVYLLGYSLGVACGSRLLARLQDLFGWAGIVMQLVGLYGLLYMPLLVGSMDPGLFRTSSLFQALLRVEGFFLHLCVSLLLFLVPSFLMGLGFPMLIQLRAARGGGAGGTIARAYSLNTLGCVLGALAAGFVLIPWLGAQRSMQGLGCLAILCGLGVLFDKRGIWRLRLPAVIVTCGLLAIVLFPRDGFISWINVCESRSRFEVELIDVIEGINTTASVHRYLAIDKKVISTAGINVAGDTTRLRQTQKVQGHVPLILHGSPHKVLTVGFGSGELTRSLTYHEIPSITCVEIAPEMVTLAKKHFSHINLGARLEEQVRIIYMDAKNYIHLTDERYDVILNDSIWPGYFAESSSLYTREYFEDGKRLLTDGGVYSTWLPINTTPASLMGILRAFTDVFENTVIVYPHSFLSEHLLLVGRKDDTPYPFLDMRREFDKPGVAESLALIGVRNVEDVLDFLLAGPASLAAWAADSPANSDDFPVVEFDVERRIRQPSLAWIMLQRLLDNTSRTDLGRLVSFEGLPQAERDEVLRRLDLSRQANEHLFRAFLAGRTPDGPRISLDDRLSELASGLAIDPHNQDLLRAGEEALRIAGHPERGTAHRALAERLLRQRQPEAALELYRQLLPKTPDDARVYRGVGLAYLQLGLPDRAITALDRSVELDPASIQGWYSLATARAALGRIDEAIEAAERALGLAESTGQDKLAARIRKWVQERTRR
jgi:spermidine synthase